MSDNTIKRYAVDSCQQTEFCAPATFCEDWDGDWVRHSDHIAALSRAREEARREGMQECIDLCENYPDGSDVARMLRHFRDQQRIDVPERAPLASKEAERE